MCIVIYRHFRKKRDAKKGKEEAEEEKISSFIEGRVEPDTEKEIDSPKSGSIFSDRYLRNVYGEMKQKCSPQNFMSPYNHEKVQIANEIYSELMSKGVLSEEQFLSLRHKAIEELGVHFDTSAIYKYLATKCSPSNFLNPYDAEKVSLANDIYSQLEKNKEDIEQLERIRDAAISSGILRFSTTDYSSLTEEKYSIGQWKTPRGTILRIETTKTEPHSSDKVYYLYEEDSFVSELIRTESKSANITCVFCVLSNHALTYQMYSLSGKLEKCENGQPVETYKLYV